MSEVARRPARELSLGQRRMLSLLRAMRPRPDGSPRLMLMDEPLAGLRGDKVEQVLRLVRARLESGWGLIVSEHVEAIAELPGLREFRMGAR